MKGKTEPTKVGDARRWSTVSSMVQGRLCLTGKVCDKHPVDIVDWILIWMGATKKLPRFFEDFCRF